MKAFFFIYPKLNFEYIIDNGTKTCSSLFRNLKISKR